MRSNLKDSLIRYPSGTVDRNASATAGDVGSIPDPEDSTCCRASKPMCHNYQAACCNYWSPSVLEPVLGNKRMVGFSASILRSPRMQLEQSPCSQQPEKSPRAATKSHSNQKKNQKKKKTKTSGHLTTIEDFSLRRKFLQSVLRSTLLPQEGVFVHGLREH